MKTKEMTNIKDLAREVSTLRSFVIGLAGKDSDGEYRPEFVEKVLKSSAGEPVGSAEIKLIETAHRKEIYH